MRTPILVLSLFLSALCAANEGASDKVHFNYQMFCQGCHTPDGTGAKSVPQLKGHVGTFLQTQEGREYLVRVPGSATSALDNEELADVLNWILTEFSGDSLAENYEPYTEGEVGRLRRNPLNEVVLYRTNLLADIAHRADAKH
jgi:hypothetical protein